MLNFYDFSKWKSFQLHGNGDYLSFFDGRDLQSQQIQKLDRIKGHYHVMDKRTISSSGKYMLVQFLTDDQEAEYGFRAYFHYMPIQQNCANWLNMKAQLLKSPDNPTIDCSWVITASSTGSNCTIHFETFEVKCIWLQFFGLIYLYTNFENF